MGEHVNIEGSTVVVTGGARGIGAAISHKLAGCGAAVVIADLDLPMARETAAACGAQALPLDVTNIDSWQSLIAHAGAVDVLVSNAGVMPVGRFVDERDAATRLQMGVNVTGVIRGARAVLPGMLERRRGVLVNIASQAGKVALAGLATYHATKFAVVGLSKALEDELHGTGVGVSCVLPGIVDTELSTGLPSTWLAPRIAPARVADSVAAAIEHPGGERWVPRRGRLLMPVAAALPVGPRRRALRSLGMGDPALGAIGSPARLAYERRIAASEECEGPSEAPAELLEELR